MFEGARYWQKCGAARGRVEEDDIDVACPGCRQMLQRVGVGATAMLECRGCDGVWIDADVFESLPAPAVFRLKTEATVSARSSGPRR
jgi:hypothetical protein